MIQRPPGGVGPGRPFSAILSTQGVDQREVAPQRCRALCFGISISPLRPKRTGEGRRGPYAAPLAIFLAAPSAAAHSLLRPQPVPKASLIPNNSLLPLGAWMARQP